MDGRPVIRIETSRLLPDGTDVVRLERPGETVILIREGHTSPELVGQLNRHLRHIAWQDGTQGSTVRTGVTSGFNTALG
jgi:hypothetical protein